MTAVADACCVTPAPRFGTRKAVLIVAALAAAGLAAVIVFALVSGDAGVVTNFRRGSPPRRSSTPSAPTRSAATCWRAR